MVKNVFVAVSGLDYDDIVEQTTETPEELGAGGFVPQGKRRRFEG